MYSQKSNAATFIRKTSHYSGWGFHPYSTKIFPQKRAGLLLKKKKCISVCCTILFYEEESA